MLRRFPQSGWGDFDIIASGDRSVLILRYDWRNNSVLFVHNLDARPREVAFSVGLDGADAEQGRLLINLLSEDHSRADDSGHHRIIITATGFNLNVLGDINFVIDEKPLVFSDTVTYRGTMFTGVPNMTWVFGYFRASWTLRADLVADFVCRLLNHMKEKGARKVTPRLRPEDKDIPVLPWIDPENFNPGYLMRGMHLLPKRGDKPEWQHTQDYWTEKDQFPAVDLDDGCFLYE